MRVSSSALPSVLTLVLAAGAAFLIIEDRVGAQNRPVPAESPEKTYTIAARVEMVALDVTVIDRHGAFVSGLAEKDFQVLEDGVPQHVQMFSAEDVPVTIGLVVDSSGSMGPKRSYVIGAALAFAQASNPEDELFVIQFNDDIQFGLQSGVDFTSDTRVLRNALLRLTCEGRTALYDALAASLEHVHKGKFPKKALLVVSDGQDNVSATNLNSVLAMARKSGAAVYTIGAYDPDSDKHNTKVLKKLADVTGGQFYFPTTLPQIVSDCRRIAKDIRNRYTVSYCSTNMKRDGSYRRVLVTATSPVRGKLAVKVREGYFAPSEEPTHP